MSISTRKPVGLRERNRQLKRNALLQAAMTLFEQKGFEASQMEEIAALAQTSTATAYNYFESKNALLTAVTILHLRQALPQRRALLNNLPDDPVEGIIAFERLLAQQTMQTLGKNCWRAIFRAAYDSDTSQLKRACGILSRIITLHYKRMFCTYRERGSLPADTDIDLIAELIVIAGTAYFTRFLICEDMKIDELVAMIPPFARTILSGQIQR